MIDVVTEVRKSVRTDVDTMVERTVFTGFTLLLNRLWQSAGSWGLRMRRSESTTPVALLLHEISQCHSVSVE